MTKNAMVASEFEGSLCLVAPGTEHEMMSSLRALSEHTHSEDFMTHTPDAIESFWPEQGSWQAQYRPYNVKAGILHIPVRGALLHDFTYQVGKWATGYYYIQKAIERGIVDPEVQGIALVVNSPGGHVAGCFELVDRIFAARSKKPIEAFAHEHAYSAAYAVASAARKITVSRTGGVGSIGVLRTHVSYEKLLADRGIEFSFIFAGAHKVDGNPYESLPDSVRTRWQTQIEESYSVFVQSVARNRKMDETAVRQTEALTFTATESVNRGLADSIGPLDDALAQFAACILCESEGDDDMSESKSTEADAKAAEQAAAEAATKAAADAKKAERARIAGIKGLEEAKKRPTAADALAMDTEMSVEQAKEFLAKLPEEGAEPEPKPAAESNSGNPDFKGAMNASGEGPGADVENSGDDNLSDDAKADKIAARILTTAFGSAEPPSARR